MKKIILTVFFLSTLSITGEAFSKNALSSFQSSASVSQTCHIGNINDLNFGEYEPTTINAMLDVKRFSSISVQCTKGTSGVYVKLNQGSNPAPGSTSLNPLRRMKSEDNKYLNYQIYTDSQFQVVFGDVLSNSIPLPVFENSINPYLVGFGSKISSGQDVAIGSYTDTVGVTITF